jgi:hypothetical protein
MKKIYSFLIISFLITGLQAQSTLYVKEKSGTQTPFELDGIRKLTFPAGNITVNKTDGNMSIYELSDIRYLSFSDFTTDVKIIARQESSNLTLFPNPVIDQLLISYESLKAGNVQVAIIDIQGKVLHQQTINSQNGTNHAIISVSQLPKGLYVCRLQNGDKLETIKFIKN